MFIFLLISAELAVLYTVFWYLFLRDPGVRHRISGSLWGTYEEALGAESPDPTLPLVNSCQCGPGEHHHVINAARVRPQEFILDQVTNHYVAVNESGSVLARMANSIDRTFSQLSARP